MSKKTLDKRDKRKEQIYFSVSPTSDKLVYGASIAKPLTGADGLRNVTPGKYITIKEIDGDQMNKDSKITEFKAATLAIDDQKESIEIIRKNFDSTLSNVNSSNRKLDSLIDWVKENV